jgi:hypothetical protein
MPDKQTADRTVIKSALQMWSSAADVARHFNVLIKQLLLDTTVKQWLLGFRCDLRNDNIDTALKLANTLMYSESVHDVVVEEEAQVDRAVDNVSFDPPRKVHPYFRFII